MRVGCLPKKIPRSSGGYWRTHTHTHTQTAADSCNPYIRLLVCSTPLVPCESNKLIWRFVYRFIFGSRLFDLIISWIGVFCWIWWFRRRMYCYLFRRLLSTDIVFRWMCRCRCDVVSTVLLLLLLPFSTIAMMTMMMMAMTVLVTSHSCHHLHFEFRIIQHQHFLPRCRRLWWMVERKSRKENVWLLLPLQLRRM